VIALNSDTTAAEKARAKRAGFYRYFEKPLKIDALLEAIEPVLAP
jgi:DNA-binding NtrC family response regulator